MWHCDVNADHCGQPGRDARAKGCAVLAAELRQAGF